MTITMHTAEIKALFFNGVYLKGLGNDRGRNDDNHARR
jgi:hypothetical protein